MASLAPESHIIALDSGKVQFLLGDTHKNDFISSYSKQFNANCKPEMK